MSEADQSDPQAPALEELEFWTKKAIGTPEWRHLAEILDKHKKHCEEQVNIYVLQRKWDEAYMWAVRADHIWRIFKLFDVRIKKLEKEIGKEE